MSHTLLILKIYTTFKDVQMILKRFFNIFTGFRFSKISVECSVHLCSCPWFKWPLCRKCAYYRSTSNCCPHLDQNLSEVAFHSRYFCVLLWDILKCLLQSFSFRCEFITGLAQLCCQLSSINLYIDRQLGFILFLFLLFFLPFCFTSK